MRMLLALCALLIAAPAWATPEPVARVTVERSGKSWTATYELLERAPVWALAESVLPRESKTSWRIGSVRVLTPGVALRRLGNYDALVAARGNVPKRVRLSFTPFTKDIEAGYDAALAFTDGSVALYADQFKLVPVRSIAAARKIPAGPSPMGQPTMLVSWAGAKPETISLGGSVLPGMVVMTLEGDALLKPNAKASQYARWFISHEAAHFWLGQAVHYSNPSESWITEGGAELLAFRATAAADASFDIKKRLSEAKVECTPFLAHGGIADAYEREGDFRAYYARGAILALAAEKASHGDFSDFVRTLISRSAADQTVTRQEWLALVDERAPGGALSAAVAKLLDKPQADPASALDAFIATAGIGDQFAPPKR